MGVSHMRLPHSLASGVMPNFLQQPYPILQQRPSRGLPAINHSPTTYNRYKCGQSIGERHSYVKWHLLTGVAGPSDTAASSLLSGALVVLIRGIHPCYMSNRGCTISGCPHGASLRRITFQAACASVVIIRVKVLDNTHRASGSGVQRLGRLPQLRIAKHWRVRQRRGLGNLETLRRFGIGIGIDVHHRGRLPPCTVLWAGHR